MGLLENKERIGAFTSSEIYKLMSVAKDGKSFGKPAIEYIKDKRYEKLLGRSLNNESNAKSLSWGKFIESRVFNLLGTEYKMCSTDTIVNPDISYHAGSPDCEKFEENTKVVCDIKCPITLKSFCELVDCKTTDELIENHKAGSQYVWQLISNAILTNAKYCELIIYVPYLSELKEIRDEASMFDGNQNKIAWIFYSEDNELPYLIEGGHYKNLNIIRWEVTETSKQQLIEKIKEAGKLLLKA